MANSKKRRIPLKQIAEKGDFEALEMYRDSKVLKRLKAGDFLNLLNLLIVWQGQLLEEEDMRAPEILTFFLELKSRDLNLLMEIAGIWFSYAKKNHNLKSFQHVLEVLDYARSVEDNESCLQLWSKTHLQVALITLEDKHFLKALEGLNQMLAIVSEEDVEILQSVHWDLGRSWMGMGKVSGEAIDFSKAVNELEAAQALGCDDAYLWNDHGNALVELACLLGREDLFAKSYKSYENCIERDPESFEAFLNAGCTAKHLYCMNSDIHVLKSAHIAFVRAATLFPNHVNIWFNWGELFLYVGKQKRSARWFREAVEKLQRAESCEKDHLAVLSLWADALMHLGRQEESISSLKEAETIVLRCVAIAPKSADVWYLYGAILLEQARYFDDNSLVIDAEDKFHYGLALNEDHQMLWYGMGVCLHLQFEISLEPEFLDQSLACFSRVEELGGNFSDLWSHWGLAQLRFGEILENQAILEKCLANFDRALIIQSVNDCDPELLYHYGCVCDILGDYLEDESYYTRSVQVLTQLLKRIPEHVNGKYNLAVSLSHLGEATGNIEYFDQAMHLFDEITTSDHEDEMAWNDWGMTLLSMAHLFIEKADNESFLRYCYEAEMKLCQAAALGNEQAYYPLACVYSMTSYYDKAMEYMEKSAELGILPPLAILKTDDSLEGLRETEHFQYFLNDHGAHLREEEDLI